MTVVEPVETAAGRRAAWHAATVAEVRPETASARRLILEVPTWPGNDAGSPLAVDELPDGEVSPFLVHDLQVGDQLEVHGPLGAYFVWRPPAAGEATVPVPVQLIAGGSGVVPLYAMLSAHAAAGDASEFRLLYSVRTPADAFFRDELDATMAVDYIYTRQVPDGWPTPAGRITKAALQASTLPPERSPRVYVCGPTPFVETVADWLIELGHATTSIRTERFGGS